MKKINQYNLFRLLLFSCFIGLILGVITILLKNYTGRDIYNACAPLIWYLINGVVIILTLIVLNKTEKDNFLLKKK
jgi:uncharacterized membrane protein